MSKWCSTQLQGLHLQAPQPTFSEHPVDALSLLQLLVADASVAQLLPV